MKEIVDLLGVNPVFVTQIVGSVVALCSVLGVKELLSKAYDRYCNKADQKEVDHQKLEQLGDNMTEVLALVKELKGNEAKYLDNDMLIIANDLLMLQRKAKMCGRVAESCYPWYMKLFNRYKELNDGSEMEFDTEIEMNHKLIEQMLANGDVVPDFKELYVPKQ